MPERRGCCPGLHNGGPAAAANVGEQIDNRNGRTGFGGADGRDALRRRPVAWDGCVGSRSRVHAHERRGEGTEELERVEDHGEDCRNDKPKSDPELPEELHDDWLAVLLEKVDDGKGGENEGNKGTEEENNAKKTEQNVRE